MWSRISFSGPSIADILAGNQRWDAGKHSEAIDKYESFFLRDNFEHHLPTDGEDTVGYALYNCMSYFLHQNRYDVASLYLNKINPNSPFKALMLGTYLTHVHPYLRSTAIEYLSMCSDTFSADALIYRAQMHFLDRNAASALNDFQSAYGQISTEEDWKRLYVLTKIRKISQKTGLPTVVENSKEEAKLIQAFRANIDNASVMELMALLIADQKNKTEYAKRILALHHVNYIPLYMEEDFLRVFRKMKSLGLSTPVSTWISLAQHMAAGSDLGGPGGDVPFIPPRYKDVSETKDLFLRIIASCKDEKLQLETLDLILDGDRRSGFLAQLFHEQTNIIGQPSIKCGRLQDAHNLREALRARDSSVERDESIKREDVSEEFIKSNPLDSKLYYLRSRKFYMDSDIIPLSFDLDCSRTRNDKPEELNERLLNARNALYLNPVSLVYRKWLASVYYLLSTQKNVNDAKFNEYEAKAIAILNAGIKLGLDCDDYLQEALDRISLGRAKLHFNNLKKLSPGSLFYIGLCKGEIDKIKEICEDIKTSKVKAYAYYVFSLSLYYPIRDLPGQWIALETALKCRPQEPMLHYGLACLDILNGNLKEARIRIADTTYDEVKFAANLGNYLKTNYQIALAIFYANQSHKNTFRDYLLKSEFTFISDIELNDFYFAMSRLGIAENFLPPLSNKQVNKGDLFESIKAISNCQVKIETLIQSLSKLSLLGQYFHIKRLSSVPTVTNGTLKEIVKELQVTLEKYPAYEMSSKTKAILNADSTLLSGLKENYGHLYQVLVSKGNLVVNQMPIAAPRSLTMNFDHESGL